MQLIITNIKGCTVSTGTEGAYNGIYLDGNSSYAWDEYPVVTTSIEDTEVTATAAELTCVLSLVLFASALQTFT